jgi:hypothetical protein
MATTGADIVADVRAEVIEPSPTFFSNERMLALVNLAQKEYVRRTRCLQNFAWTSTVQGESAYPMPSDWLGSECIFWNDMESGSSNWRRIAPTSLEKMAQESPNFLSSDSQMLGKPQKYYIVGSTLYLFPKPLVSGSNDIFMYYQSREIPLVSLSDPLSVDDSLAPGLRAYVLWKLWKQDQENDLAEEQHDLFKEEIGNGIRWRNQRTLDLKRKIDIESYQPYSYSSMNKNSGNQAINPLNLS